jgi:hypothetical protein
VQRLEVPDVRCTSELENPDAWETLVETFNAGVEETAPWPAMEIQPKGLARS